MRGKMDCYGVTDVGVERENNEDQFLIADLKKSMQLHQTSLGLDHQTRLYGSSQGRLLVVADGMGGAADGERASAIAVDSLTHYVLNTLDWFFRLDEQREHDFLDELKAALEECQAGIQHEVETVARRAGMGTTLTMAYIIWPRMYVVHVGDTRCYLHHRGRLKQLTTDHTVAQQLEDEGTMNHDEAENSHWQHVLWNVVGGDSSDIEPEVHMAQLTIGDSILLCSDGLTGCVSDEALREALESDQSAKQVAEGLVGNALDAGAPDNVTVVVARFIDSDSAQAQSEIEEADVEEDDPAHADTVLDVERPEESLEPSHVNITV